MDKDTPQRCPASSVFCSCSWWFLTYQNSESARSKCKKKITGVECFHTRSPKKSTIFNRMMLSSLCGFFSSFVTNHASSSAAHRPIRCSQNTPVMSLISMCMEPKPLKNIIASFLDTTVHSFCFDVGVHHWSRFPSFQTFSGTLTQSQSKWRLVTLQ